METKVIRNLLFVISGLAICASTSWGQDKPAPTNVSGKIEWVFDYEKGKRLSLESGKPMFVVIWCER